MGKHTKVKTTKATLDKPSAEQKPAGDAASSSAARSGVSKKKHGLAKRTHALLPQLEASAPEKRPESAKAKSRRKRTANSNILGAVDGLRSSLDELLAANEKQHRERAAATDGDAASSHTMSSKKRQKLVAEETAHMQQVIQHPAFVADPFAALQEHLHNTIGAGKADRAKAGGGRAAGGEKKAGGGGGKRRG
jgi:hypothetical protein